MLEADDSGDDRVVNDHVADNLPGSRATKDRRFFEVRTQFVDKSTGL
jgi:hypothetical protein